jgi:hypothetical protein
MNKVLSVLIAASLLSSQYVLADQAPRTITPGRSVPNIPVTGNSRGGVDASSSPQLVKLLAADRKDRIRLEEAREEFWGAAKHGGTVFVVSAGLLATLLSMAKYMGQPALAPVKRILASRGVQVAGVSILGPVAVGSVGLTTYEMYQINDIIDEAKITLDREEADLIALQKTMQTH